MRHDGQLKMLVGARLNAHEQRFNSVGMKRLASWLKVSGSVAILRSILM
jgi:hypothetical protein